MNELGNGPWDKNYKPSGISRGEEAALKAYPVKQMYNIYHNNFEDVNIVERIAFQEGYGQAEKDTIERAIAWLKENGTSTSLI